jgi:competence protein ComEC
MIKRSSIYIAILAFLGCGCLITWQAVFYFTARAEGLSVTIFDVGQGDAIFLEFPDGKQILIDGGPDKRVLEKLGRAIPFWDRTIDMVVLTHPHQDHITGLLGVLTRYDADHILESGVAYGTAEQVEWQRILKQSHTPIIIARAGQRIVLGYNAYLDVVFPVDDMQGVSLKNVHDAMVVIRLTYGRTTMMLTGDAERNVEYKILGSGMAVESNILKIGHHGSKTSSSEQFLLSVHPSLAIISSGRNNNYGHPHQEIIDRLGDFGIPVLRTDIDGDIRFISDGSEWRKK